jgi:hypothetical protein
MNAILTDPEATVNGNQPRMDWKLPVFLTVLNLIFFAVQYGTLQSKVEETVRRQDQQERHMEFIDTELKSLGAQAGEVKEFRHDVERRFDATDKKLDDLGRRR